MESKNVKYGGLSTSPDDYQCEDGAVAFASGAVYEDGALRVIPPAAAKGLVVGPEDKVFLHKQASYTHYVVVYDLLLATVEADPEVRLAWVNADLIDEYRAWARQHDLDTFLSGTDRKGKTFYEYYGDNVMAAVLSRTTSSSDRLSNLGSFSLDFANRQYDADGNRVYSGDPEAKEVATDNEFPDIYNLMGYFEYNDSGIMADIRLSGSFIGLVCVGNTLVVSTSKGTHYFLWRAQDVGYTYLGDALPSAELRFGLQMELRQLDFLKCCDNISSSESYTANEGSYTTLAQYSFSKGRASGTLYALLKDGGENEFAIKAGYMYRAYHLYSSGKNKRTLYIKGSNSSNFSNSVTLITLDKHTGTYHYATATGNYRYCFLKIEKNNVQGTVYVEESKEKVSETPTSRTRRIMYSSSSDSSSPQWTCVMGVMNRFVNDEATKRDKFIYPFFVRYATRLYDGTHVCLSPPVLMCPNSGYAPVVIPEYNSNANSLFVYGYVGSLCHKITQGIGEEWTDIVRGVDIFVSAQFYPYDQGKGYDQYSPDISYICFSHTRKEDGTTTVELVDSTSNAIPENISVGTLGDLDDMETESSQSIMDANLQLIADIPSLLTTDSSNTEDLTFWQIATRSEEERNDLVTSCANFYKIADVSCDDLSNADSEWQETDIEDGTLSSLEARQTLKEEVVAIRHPNGSGLYLYNNRLHVYSGTHDLPGITNPLLQNGYSYFWRGYNNGSRLASGAYGVAVRVRTDQGDKLVVLDNYNVVYPLGCPWFFYPDSRAYEMLFCVGGEFFGGDRLWISVPLTEHDFLNGAYAFNGFGNIMDIYLNSTEDNGGLEFTPDDAEEVGALTEDRSEYNNNKIYVSDASNPFVFRNDMVCTVGAGQILALAAAARAVSQGQFGQFPLYALTDEGIWTLSVGSTGAYDAVQPMARDVETNDAAVTQLDSEVMFVSDRGVMLASGSGVVCMSDAIDGDFGQFDPTSLPLFTEIAERFLGMTEEEVSGSVGAWASETFYDFIRGCDVNYDYVHQRLTLFSPSTGMAYVYSLKSKEWCMRLCDLVASVESYPRALALRHSVGVGYLEGVKLAELVDMSEYDMEAERRPLVFVTRPLKLGAADILKTVQDMVQRGYFRQDEKERRIEGAALYGSPDLYNWFLVKNSVGNKIENVHGSPYKYFRVLVVARLEPTEGISGCTVWYNPRDAQRLR